MTTKSKVLLGILGAAAAGVIIGLLVAPEKGSDMRKKIRKTAGDWADNLNHLWADGKETAEDTLENVRDKVRQTRSSVEEKANKVKESFS